MARKTLEEKRIWNRLGELVTKARLAQEPILRQIDLAQHLDGEEYKKVLGQLSRFESTKAKDDGSGLSPIHLQKVWEKIGPRLQLEDYREFLALSRALGIAVPEISPPRKGSDITIGGSRVRSPLEIPSSWQFWLGEGQTLAYDLRYDRAGEAFRKALTSLSDRHGNDALRARALVTVELAHALQETGHHHKAMALTTGNLASETQHDALKIPRNALDELRQLGVPIVPPGDCQLGEQDLERLARVLDSNGLEAYAKIARLSGSQFLLENKFTRADNAFQAVEVIGRFLEEKGEEKGKRILGDALYWRGSRLFEEGSTAQIGDFGWRTLRHKNNLEEARNYFKKARKARSPDDWIGLGTDWRQEAKVHFLLHPRAPNELEYLLDAAKDRFGTHESSLSLYLQQGRVGVALVREDYATPQERPAALERETEDLLRETIRLSWRILAWGNLSKAMALLGELYRARASHRAARDLFLAAVLTWPDTPTARDFRRAKDLFDQEQERLSEGVKTSIPIDLIDPTKFPFDHVPATALSPDHQARVLRARSDKR